MKKKLNTSLTSGELCMSFRNLHLIIPLTPTFRNQTVLKGNFHSDGQSRITRIPIDFVFFAGLLRRMEKDSSNGRPHPAPSLSTNFDSFSFFCFVVAACCLLRGRSTVVNLLSRISNPYRHGGLVVKASAS